MAAIRPGVELRGRPDHAVNQAANDPLYELASKNQDHRHRDPEGGPVQIAKNGAKKHHQEQCEQNADCCWPDYFGDIGHPLIRRHHIKRIVGGHQQGIKGQLPGLHRHCSRFRLENDATSKSKLILGRTDLERTGLRCNDISARLIIQCIQVAKNGEVF